MNSEEYKDWLREHVKRFPSVKAWMENQCDIPFINAEWEAILSGVSFSSCVAASRAMLAGEIERPYPEDTATVIRRWASDADSDDRQRFRDEQTTSHNPFLCELCDNTGMVICYHPLVVRGHREGVDAYKNGQAVIYAWRRKENGDRVPALKEVAVACKCRLGDDLAKDRHIARRTRKFEANQRFGDSPYHVKVVNGLAQDLGEAQ